jgi:hypothetical protein
MVEMTFAYTLTIDDISAFRMYKAQHIPLERRMHQSIRRLMVLLGALGLPATGWLLDLTAKDYAAQATAVPWTRMLLDWGPWVFMALFSVRSLVRGFRYWSYLPATIQQRVRMYARFGSAKEVQQLFGPYQLALNPTHYTLTSPTSKVHQKWAALHAVHRTNAAWYLFTSATEAVIVPRHAVEPSMQWPAFCALLRDYTVSYEVHDSPGSGGEL